MSAKEWPKILWVYTFERVLWGLLYFLNLFLQQSFTNRFEDEFSWRSREWYEWTKASITQYKLQGRCEENVVQIITRCCNSCHVKE